MGGMGMIAVGVLGAPFLGALQDQKLDMAMQQNLPAIHAQVAEAPRPFQLIRGVDNRFTVVGPYQPLDKAKLAALPEPAATQANNLIAENKQKTLARFAVLPLIMALGYAMLIFYFVTRGGYKPVVIGAGH